MVYLAKMKDEQTEVSKYCPVLSQASKKEQIQ